MHDIDHTPRYMPGTLDCRHGKLAGGIRHRGHTGMPPSPNSGRVPGAPDASKDGLSGVLLIWPRTKYRWMSG
jgi:hypothetical protein